MFAKKGLSKKWLMATPLLLFGLAACQHHRKDSASNGFTGFWLNARAYQDYMTGHTPDGGQDMAYFCKQVKANPEIHGAPLTEDGSPQYSAIVITDDENVYRWVMGTSPEELQTGRVNYIGKIGEDGYVTVESTEGQTKFSYLASQEGGYDLIGKLGRVVLEPEENILTAYSRSGGDFSLGHAFHRISDQQIAEYGDMASRCLHDLPDYGEQSQQPGNGNLIQPREQRYSPQWGTITEPPKNQGSILPEFKN